MGTIRQKLVAKKIKNTIDKNILTTGGKIAESSGYSKSMQDNPKRVFDTKGVKEELSILGFSEVEADEVVGGILVNGTKEETQLKAADLIYKRTGAYAPEKSQSVNLNLNTEIKSSKESRDLVDEYESRMSEMLKQPKNEA
jgi:hypothetical protein